MTDDRTGDVYVMLDENNTWAIATHLVIGHARTFGYVMAWNVIVTHRNGHCTRSVVHEKHLKTGLEMGYITKVKL